MKRLKILLSVKTRAENYIRAIEAAGAKATAEYLPKIDTGYDGLILCGGSDVDPRHYNEEIDGSVYIDAQRDENELMLLRAFIDAGKPILGICRGHQLINVYFGGSLYQHIPESELHIRHGECDSAHVVRCDEGGIISRLYGDELSVNSAHHQAVKALGEGLRATAWWENKYIEAIEHTSLPVFGVQWHPERMCCRDVRDDMSSGAAVFEYFVSLCGERRE